MVGMQCAKLLIRKLVSRLTTLRYRWKFGLDQILTIAEVVDVRYQTKVFYVAFFLTPELGEVPFLIP